MKTQFHFLTTQFAFFLKYLYHYPSWKIIFPHKNHFSP